MADHGTLILVTPPVRVLIGSYALAGTTPCPEVPGPPTTGQLWPRGNTTVLVEPPPEETDSYADVVMADSPAVYLTLDTATAADSSGNGRMPTETGTITKSQPPLIAEAGGYSWKMLGAQYLQWAAASWNNSASATWEAWVRPASLAATYCAIWDGDSGNRRFQLTAYNGRLRFIWWTTTSGPHTITSAATVAVDTTYHVVVTYDSTTGACKMYVNGSETASGTSPAMPLYTPGPYLTLGVGGGGSSIGTGGYWNGMVDEAAYYTTALSAARVLAHYEAGVAPA